MTHSTEQNRVVIRGAGDVASGVIRRLVQAGYNVIALEKPDPDFVRRYVSFGEACYRREFSIDDITAILVRSADEAAAALNDRFVPVLIDPEGHSIPDISPMIVVDARMLKKDIDTYLEMAPIVIGLGPGFTIGQNCHAAVETIRGRDLGRVLFTGSPRGDTRIPASVEGYDIQRVLRSPVDGIFAARKEICDMVKSGDIVGEVAGVEIASEIDGIVRGLIHDSLTVSAGQKIGDIDPRGDADLCYTISDKADAIGQGVIEAIRIVKQKIDS